MKGADRQTKKIRDQLMVVAAMVEMMGGTMEEWMVACIQGGTGSRRDFRATQEMAMMEVIHYGSDGGRSQDGNLSPTDRGDSETTLLDLDTKAESRRRTAEVEPGGQWTKATPV